jgi:hypothetical protein
MRHAGIASPNQLAMMHKILNVYCATYDVSDNRQREYLANLILLYSTEVFGTKQCCWPN